MATIPPRRPSHATPAQDVRPKETSQEGPTIDCVIASELIDSKCIPVLDGVLRSSPKAIKNAYSTHYPKVIAKHVQDFIRHQGFRTHGK